MIEIERMVKEFESWEAPHICVHCVQTKKGYEVCRNKAYFKYLNMLGYNEDKNNKLILYYYEGPFDNTAIPFWGIAVQTITYDNDKVNIDTKFLPIVYTLPDSTVHIQVVKIETAPSLCWGRAKKSESENIRL